MPQDVNGMPLGNHASHWSKSRAMGRSRVRSDEQVDSKSSRGGMTQKDTYTLRLFTIAVENGPFIDGLPGFTY